MKKLILLMGLISHYVMADLPLMLLQTYENQDITGWVMSEKLDGVRGYWDGDQLLSRQGNPFSVPNYFSDHLPPFTIDGEFFSQRNRFEQISAIVRSSEDKGWNQLKFYVFDVRQAAGNLFERLAVLERYLKQYPSPYIEIIQQIPIQEKSELTSYLQHVESLGGEGVVVRNPNIPYETKLQFTNFKI